MKPIKIKHTSMPLSKRLSGWLLIALTLFNTFFTAYTQAANLVSTSRIATDLSVNYEFEPAPSNQPFMYQRANYVSAVNEVQNTSVSSFYSQVKQAGIGAPLPAMGKLVGDGFVQNRYIRYQIHQQLGRHIIDSALYADEAAEINTLYENAYKFAANQASRIPFGTPLTADENIPNDMVWPEFRVINNQKTLVPIVYLSKKTLDERTVKGHDIELGESTNLKSMELSGVTLKTRREAMIGVMNNLTLNNNSSIKASGDLSVIVGGTLKNIDSTITSAAHLNLLATQLINSGGTLSAGGTLTIDKETGQVQNLSGIIKANGTVKITAGEIISKPLVFQFKDQNGSGTRLGTVASIDSVNGNVELDTMQSTKGNGDITIAGATINASNGAITFDARRDINITGISSGYQTTYQDGDWEVNQSSLDIQQSKLGAKDTIRLSASGAITISASELISTQGGIELLAGQGIYILDELTQEQIQRVDGKGKTTGQSSEFRTEAVRAVLQAGKGILLRSDHGDVTLKASKLSSTEGTQVQALDGKVRLLMTKELEEFHLQTVKKGDWQIKTRTEDVIDENNIQNAIVGGFQVQATKGIDVEYTGKPGATLQEQIEVFRQMPEMKWMANLYDDATKTLTLTQLDEVHKEVKKTSKTLSPAAMAIIAIAVCVAMGPAGAQLIGSGGGISSAVIAAGGNATLGAALSAGALTLTTQAVQSLAAGNNLGDTLNTMGSKESLKSLAISMATAGALQNTDLKMFEAVKSDSLGLSFAKQAGQAVYNSTVTAGISTAINGGNSKEFFNSFKQGLLSSAVDKLGEKMAKTIGAAYDNGSPEGISNSLRYIAHAGAGCIYGIASAAASQSENNEKYSCFSGAGGAVIGELVADQFKDHHQIAERQKATEDWLALNGIDATTQDLTPEQAKQMQATVPANFIPPAELRKLQAQGVDLAKLGAGLAAFIAKGDVNIAANAGEIAAENNALPLVIYSAMLALSAVSTYLIVQDTVAFLEKFSDPATSEEEKQKLLNAFAKTMGINIAATAAGLGALKGAKALIEILKKEGKVSERVIEELDRGAEALDSGKRYEADGAKNMADSHASRLPIGNNVVTRSADDVNKSYPDGFIPPYKPGTEVYEFVTAKEQIYVRVHGDNNMNSTWMMKLSEIEGLNAAQIQSKFALPSQPKYVSEVYVPAGTKIRAGEANPIFGGTGGGLQYELQYHLPNSAFKNTMNL
ncbi:MAG: hypothetical protein RL497_1656 [Pseudomonadota bacterium]